MISVPRLSRYDIDLRLNWRDLHCNQYTPKTHWLKFTNKLLHGFTKTAQAINNTLAPDGSDELINDKSEYFLDSCKLSSCMRVIFS